MKQIFNKLTFALVLIVATGFLLISSIVKAAETSDKTLPSASVNYCQTGQFFYDTNGSIIANPSYDPRNPDTGCASNSGSIVMSSTGNKREVPPTDDISLVAGLDKASYITNDPMLLTSSAMMSASMGYVPNILVNGVIVGSNNYPITMIDNTSGGKNIYGGANFIAPSTPGNYVLRVNATQTSLPTYGSSIFKLYDPSGSPIASKTITAWAYMKSTAQKGDTVIITTDANGEVLNVFDSSISMDIDVNTLSTYYYLSDTTTAMTIEIEQTLVQTAGTSTVIRTIDLPFSVVASSSSTVISPSITVWTNSDCNNSDRSDRKKVRKNDSTTVCWEAKGLGVDAYCTSPDQPANGPATYPTTGSFSTDKIVTTKDFVVTCKDKEINDAIGGTTGKGTTGTTKTGGSACFVADTFVTLANGTKKNIQDVQIGDVLKGDKTNNTVIGFHQPKLGSKLLYSFNGGRFFVTAEHPFKTIDGWKSIDPKITMSENIGITVTPLKVGDTLITDHGNVLLKTIDSKSASADTQLYNFFLTGDHTYYADGYLVHNKEQAVCDADGNCHAYSGAGSTGGIWTYTTGGDSTTTTTTTTTGVTITPTYGPYEFSSH